MATKYRENISDVETPVEKQSAPLDNVTEIDDDINHEWNNMSEEEQLSFEKKLIHKLDLRVLPWLTLLYLLSFLDRANIGNAKIQGV